MPHLYQRGKTWWCQVRQPGKLIRFSLRTRDKAIAKRVLADLEYETVKRRVLTEMGFPVPKFAGNGFTGSPQSNEREPVRALPLPQDSVSLSELWEVYRKWATTNTRPNTLSRRALAWKRLAEFSNGQPITPKSLEDFKTMLVKAGCKPWTVAGYLGDIKAIISVLVRLEAWSGPNPAAAVKRVKIPKRPPKFLDVKQVDCLLDAARKHSPDMELFCALGVFAGLRRGEIVNVRWSWVSWQEKTLTVQPGHGFTPKDSDCRTLPMSDRLLAILTPHKQDSGYLIRPSKQPAKWQYRVDDRDGFAAVTMAAGVPWCTVHVLRHTFASLLVQSGVSIYKVQQWLGHSDAATTAIYAHLQAYDHDVNGKG